MGPDAPAPADIQCILIRSCPMGDLLMRVFWFATKDTYGTRVEVGTISIDKPYGWRYRWLPSPSRLFR